VSEARDPMFRKQLAQIWASSMNNPQKVETLREVTNTKSTSDTRK
jgi:hypothetical protein